MTDRMNRFQTPRSLAAILNGGTADAAERPAEPAPIQDETDDAAKISAADIASNKSELSGPVDRLTVRDWHNLREFIATESAAIEVLVFAVGEESFAIPIWTVSEVLDQASIVTLPEMPENLVGVVIHSGTSIPVLDSRPFLGVAGGADQPSILLLKSDGGGVGIAVDALVGSLVLESSVVRRVPALEDQEGAFIGVFFDAGRLVALLDPSSFVRGRQGQARTQSS